MLKICSLVMVAIGCVWMFVPILRDVGGNIIGNMWFIGAIFLSAVPKKD